LIVALVASVEAGGVEVKFSVTGTGGPVSAVLRMAS
jgi:hypothetical protein